ncbi:retinol dehydrogenase 10-A-like [Ambystoma mexicanum]|uniref:retinol dehydrogenase 10-A-like n=1 Tax=Ambystoma mexicanum TaxID=8296 RepID=UPI0037E7C82A
MMVLVESLILLANVGWHVLQTIILWIRKPTEKSVGSEICLITGTASGLGRLFALEFAKRGATLVLWDIHAEGNAATATQVRAMGVNAYAYACDVSQREEVYETAEKVRREVGDVTILINNAGVAAGMPLLQCSDELLERTLRMNCHAHFWTVKAFLPKMIEMNRGHIVTISSYHGLIATAGIEDYCASKFATVGFHESLSHQLKVKRVDGVKTTLVCPYNANMGLASGYKIRKDLEFLVSHLTPEYHVKAAMNAILINQPMICIPRVTYLAAFSKHIMPWEAQVLAHKFMGEDKGIQPIFQDRNEEWPSMK